MEHLRDLYAGDIEAARLAHAGAREHAEQVAVACAGSGDVHPDCGPYGAGWYSGDVEAARAAHSQHLACEHRTGI